MNEHAVIKKARQFIKDAKIDSVPVNVYKCASEVNARIKIYKDMDDEESGQTSSINDEWIIMVNGNHSKERQRFTILHEIGHIVLGLPSKHHHHKDGFSENFIGKSRRPKEEALCDLFAAECLFPHDFFMKDINDTTISLENIEKLAEKYEASITVAGSCFTRHCQVPCAFILIENERIKYVNSSESLRNMNGWIIKIGSIIHKDSVSYKLSNKKLKRDKGCDEVPVHIWFDKKIKNYEFCIEEVRWVENRKLCLTFIRFDETQKSGDKNYDYDEINGDTLLEELDGNPPWPSKR